MTVFDCEDDFGVKLCSNCERYLPHTRFGVRSWTRADGTTKTIRKSQCRDCISSKNLSRYHEKTSTQIAHRKASYKHRLKSYGLTPEGYEGLLEKAGHVCEICKAPPLKGRYLSVDHCHTTGKVRGVLCNPCNSALGMLKENPDNLLAMLEYLKKDDELHSS